MKFPTFDDARIGKVLKGTGIAALTGALTFLLGALDVYDVGAFTPIAVTILGALLNIIKVVGTKYEPTP